MQLIIGNKNYSSWSLRPWLLMRELGIAFEETLIPLYRADSRARQLSYSPAGKVPVLVDGEIAVWDSLAIIEYLAERFPALNIWPRSLPARALARCISAEMHAGFGALRANMPMNLRASLPGKGLTPEVAADIARIGDIWHDCRARYGADGDFLFGAFSAADAMFAPVVTRFQTYGIALAPACQSYAEAVLALPAMREWTAAAIAESDRIAASEPYAA